MIEDAYTQPSAIRTHVAAAAEDSALPFVEALPLHV